jgi:hypothetical protein
MPDQDETGFTLKPSIPQLFYDIIARIVPGTVIIGLLALAAAGPEKSARIVADWLNKPGERYPSIIVIVIFGFVLSYTLAIVFLGLCHVMSKLVPKRMKPSSPDEEFPMKYDFIKSRDPAAGSRITKLTAERHMAGILTFGLSLSLIVNFLMWSTGGSRIALTVVLALAILGSVGAFRYFIDRQNHAIKNYCKLHGYDDWRTEWLAACEKSSKPDPLPPLENGKREASSAVPRVSQTS